MSGFRGRKPPENGHKGTKMELNRETPEFGTIRFTVAAIGAYVTDGTKEYEVDNVTITVKRGAWPRTAMDLPESDIWVMYDLTVIDRECDRTTEKVQLAWYQVNLV